jgi:hypothetical protein
LTRKACEAIADTISSGIKSAMDIHHGKGNSNLIKEG